MDKYGICVSTGSACDSQSLEPSHVILALGRPYEYANGNLRFTLGRQTSKKDLDFVLKVLPKIVLELRAISPVKVSMDAKDISSPESFIGQKMDNLKGKKNPPLM